MSNEAASVGLLFERTTTPQWTLVGRLNGGGEARCTVLDPLPFSIGRRPEASLTLARQTVSGMHAELYAHGECLYVRDLGSTNGTYVNGERIAGAARLADGDVIQFADMPFQVSCARRQSESRTMCENVCDHALALVQFQTLMRDGAVIPHFQPIVDLRTGRTLAFEVLARSRMMGLETASGMFAAAAELNLEAELSDLMRVKGIELSGRFAQTPHLFLNTHPAELAEGASFDWLVRLRSVAPSQPLTIEIHEAAVTDVETFTRFRARLEELQLGLAFDDFGAGQARIAELAEVRPEYLKFDRRIIQDLDRAEASRRRFVKCLVDAVRDLGIIALAEGVETAGECDVCRELGFDLAQGFHLGSPAPVHEYRQLPAGL